MLGTCDHRFSVSLPSKKLWYLLVSIAGSLIHLVSKDGKKTKQKESDEQYTQGTGLMKTVEWPECSGTFYMIVRSVLMVN